MNPNILVVEDEVEDLELLKEAFDQLNYKAVNYYSNVYDLLTYLNGLNSTSLPRLIVADYNMPKINGFNIVSFIKRHATFGNIDIVILTGLMLEDESRRLMKAGVSKIYIKPPTFSEYKVLAGDLISSVGNAEHSIHTHGTQPL